MSDDKKSRLDPRFDPAFQRGFDPATAAAQPVPEVTAAPRSAQPVVATTVADSIAPVRNPPGNAALVETVPAAAPVAPVAPDGAGAGVGSELADDGEASANQGRPWVARNPFVLLLGILAIILIIAGVWLFSWADGVLSGAVVPSQGDYVALNALIDAAPFVSLLGIATIIALVFVLAVRRGRH